STNGRGIPVEHGAHLFGARHWSCLRAGLSAPNSAMGIRDRPISPRSPWQNPYAERLIGTLRRECLDHVLIVGEWHLRRMLASYSSYYNESRTHLALEKDAPLRRASRGAERSSPRQFFPDCTIAMCGYDFREGQPSDRVLSERGNESEPWRSSCLARASRLPISKQANVSRSPASRSLQSV